jgi:large subunit ribosomal protein L25
MIQQDMTASMRQQFGKGANFRLRQSGYAPAILYGKKSEPVPLAMEAKNLTKTLLRLHGHNAVVTLNIEGEKGKKKHHVLIKDIQTDPLTDTVLHVDFLEIDLDKEIVLNVPVVYTGIAKGVDLGGILNIMAHTVKIKGMPLAIPDEITVDWRFPQMSVLKKKPIKCALPLLLPRLPEKRSPKRLLQKKLPNPQFQKLQPRNEPGKVRLHV